MTAVPWTVRGLREALANGTTHPSALAEQALARANQNAGRNTYLWQDAAWTLAEAARVEKMPSPFGDGRDSLWGLSISVKDCFDLAGAPTSSGVKFYRDLNGNAARDSWLVRRLRAAGAVITGKTHLHPLAYGITGENPDFGDCLQPSDFTSLTGGSSSGAAASVQEGSAVAAIGTDTGGSIRVPAALCGLAGYRASLGRGDWRGGAHLAESFDTMGFIFRDLEDAPLLASLFAPLLTTWPSQFHRIAVVDGSFLHDCEPEIVASLRTTVQELEALRLHTFPPLDVNISDTIREIKRIRLEVTTVNVDWWEDAYEIFAAIQAWEAARIHAGHFEHFESSIRERLEWGAHITPDEIATLRQRHANFRERMDVLLAAHELLLLPAAPVARLAAGADHTQTRGRLLRYTTPFSLAGLPAVTIPCAVGGMQLAAARGNDEALVRLAARLGLSRKSLKRERGPEQILDT
jgi:Asp-tRNA(Asn)/Glu-tRNA(Gln) amidotransferase A subunit family amidase